MSPVASRLTLATLAHAGLTRRRLRGITSIVTTSVDVRRGGRNLVTTHGPESYPGLLVVKPGPDWQVWVIVPEDGQTVRAAGGERTYGYETVDGGRAEGFELRAGDRATLVRSGLPFSLVEWRIERASAA